MYAVLMSVDDSGQADSILRIKWSPCGKLQQLRRQVILSILSVWSPNGQHYYACRSGLDV